MAGDCQSISRVVTGMGTPPSLHPIKVALVSPIYPPGIGGPSTQTHHLARLLKCRGVKAFVFTLAEKGVHPKTEDGVTVYGVEYVRGGGVMKSALQYIRITAAVAKIFRQERPDVVHVQAVDFLALVVGIVARRFRIPSVVKYAGDFVWERMNRAALISLPYEKVFDSTLKARILTYIERSILSQYDRIWATSAFQRDSLVRLLRISENRIVSHPNFISLRPFASHSRRDGPLTILSACRFARWKNVDLVIRAFAHLNTVDARLIIVGGGSTDVENELKALAQTLAIKDRVTFTGSVSPLDIHQLFHEADIFVSGSSYEPFGIVLVEAMAAGLPVVATRTGGIPEVVPDGAAGYLVEPGDVQAMASRLQLLLDDEDLRSQLGETGSSWARRFELTENIGVFLELYRELTSSRTTHP